MRERASAICVNDGKVLLVELKDPTSGRRFFVPPGGLIEMHERPEQAAIRETFEETGCLIEVQPMILRIYDYLFDWNGQKVPCRTHYFGARLIREEEKPVDAEYNLGKIWDPIENILSKVEKQGDIHIITFELAERMLRHSQRGNVP